MQILFFLNPKVQASSLLLHLHRQVCVRSGQNLKDTFLCQAAQPIVYFCYEAYDAVDSKIVRIHSLPSDNVVNEISVASLQGPVPPL